MSDSRPITSIEKTGHSELVIGGVLDDGLVDSNGEIIDPGWLREAAAEWLATVPVVTTGGMRGVGSGIEVIPDGAITRVRVKIGDQETIARITAGTLSQFSLGISQPTIETAVNAPGGRLKGGKLLHVGLQERHASQSGNGQATDGSQ